MKIREITLKLEIPKSMIHEIVYDTFGYLKVSARWVPKMLTEDHKLQKVEISQRLLLRCQQDNGDEDMTHIAKVVANVLWDAKGVILLDILPQGQCNNAAQYCSTLDRLRDALCRRRPGLLRRDFVIQHDIATPHSDLHSNGCSATVGKFFPILPTVQTSHPLFFICLEP
ncbi:histone-lysine N-methyltransferase SETMAR [Elysia marginata]|uniref:Histone-lysine N-methyltransferase SETMAR n=1 Tax=Elysia marginata TaxID=1093978 RepID=A0AAV4GY81_9GAST|nr:histone-lysine N-methyltransferase SETMAR [Elysia marginata]